MKNKLISLLLVGVMVLGNASMVMAEEPGTTQENSIATVAETQVTYPTAYGSQALDAVEEGTGVIIDVRSEANYNKYHLAESAHVALFGDDGSIAADSELAKAFLAYAKSEEGEAAMKDKNVYILCNSGARGAQLATELLVEAGYPNEKLFTITNGAKDIAILNAAIGDSWDSEANTVNPKRVTGAEAVAAVGNENVVILDVRATEVREMNGHLKGSVSQPLFTWDGTKNTCVNVLSSDDPLVSDFTKFATDNKDAYNNKSIYILCNGGQSGARAALKLLLSVGYNFDNLYVITGGASDADVKAALTYDYNYASGAEALEAQSNGAVIIDVRSDANHKKYSVEGSVSIPLFFDAGSVSSGDDTLAKTFTTTVTGNKDLAGKKLYILCNSGARGAQLATQLLLKAGYSMENIYTITNGAKDIDILDAAIGNGGDTWNNEYPNFVSGKDAVAAVDNKNVVILDVRATDVRKADGALKNSLSQPLFNYVGGKNQVTTLHDDLAANFLAFVKGNENLAGKEIYILCNGGQSGARAALKLLLSAGYSYDNIKVIKGGASDADVKAALEPVGVTNTVQTGDSSNMVMYVMLMFLAVAAVAESKRRLAAK